MGFLVFVVYFLSLHTRTLPSFIFFLFNFIFVEFSKLRFPGELMNSSLVLAVYIIPPNFISLC